MDTFNMCHPSYGSLYAAGALVNHFVTDSEVEDADEDNDEVEEDEEIAPGQMR